MDRDAPEKRVMRRFWAEVAHAADGIARENCVPLYLTLGGAEGRDIQVLIEEGLVQTTETGAIAEESMGRVVAVERNRTNGAALNRRFPGLTIREVDFENLLHGPKPTRFPIGDNEDYCRAAIINLDLDQTLTATENGNEIQFPVINWIRKLSQIHSTAPRLNWYLCLTLHGEIHWSAAASQLVQDFLAENFRHDEQFRSASADFVGDDLVQLMLGADGLDFSALTVELQQKILMLVVPKKIASLVVADGWSVLVEKNVRYGGEDKQAPMVSWILKFEDGHRRALPRRYKESLATILIAPIAIDRNGVTQ